MAGERRAFDELVERYHRLVWHIARSSGLSAEDAADVSQTVWLRFVEQMGRIQDPERTGAWLATTTRRECIAVGRRRDRTVPVDLTGPLESPAFPATAPIDEERIDRSERAVAVRTAFTELSERCQALLSLLVADPAPSYEEISAALDMPVGSIGPTRQRCLKSLSERPQIARITPRPAPSAG